MSDFDWRDYPDLLDTADDHRSDNLLTEYNNLVSKEIMTYIENLDHSHISKIFTLLDEYNSIVQKNEKFKYKDWRQTKLMMGAKEGPEKAVGHILYMLPVTSEQIYQTTSNQFCLLVVYISFNPLPVIGQENQSAIKIDYQLLSNDLSIEKVEINQEIIEFKLSDGYEYIFDDLPSWKLALNLKIESITVNPLL